LLGGSFNPAHGGHLHISLMALQRLDLDEVWWLVSPQNPLKPIKGMAPFAKRVASAAALARGHGRISVSAIEAALGTTYTADTIRVLQRRFPHTRFVWLMGGDNLAQLPRWRQWEEIVESVPIAVFDRPETALMALAGKAAKRYALARVPARRRRFAPRGRANPRSHPGPQRRPPRSLPCLPEAAARPGPRRRRRRSY
jgi:nicotinate-nucleotide adenylyltransferase